MKVLFFDIDGVLGHKKWWDQLPKGTPACGWIDPECVQRLNDIDAELVCISSWPYYFKINGTQQTRECLQKAGLDKRILDFATSSVNSDTKPGESTLRWTTIREWIRICARSRIESYAIVDDQPWGGFPPNRFVQTDMGIGLTDSDVERIHQILEM